MERVEAQKVIREWFDWQIDNYIDVADGGGSFSADTHHMAEDLVAFLNTKGVWKK